MAGIADEVFCEAGTATGVEGIGGQQATVAVKSITHASKPQVSFSDVPANAQETALSAWTGGGLQIVFTVGRRTDTLAYLNLWTPPAGKYPAEPVRTATSKYLLGKTL